MEEINKFEEDFISHDPKNFKFKLGRVLASSLSGFIAGIVVTAIVFYALFDMTLKVVGK